MSKQPVRVVTGRKVQLTAPGMLGRKFDFQPGYSFLTAEWFFPGEPYQQGNLAGTACAEWRFGTNTATDLPLTFEAGDVREVIIADDPETIRIFERAPFKVIIQDRQP